MAKRWMIALTCFACSGLGAAIALHFDRAWWIGLVAGGIFGYLGYEPATTWRVFRQVFGSLWHVLTLKIWIPSWRWSIECFKFSLVMGVRASNAGYVPFVSILLLALLAHLLAGIPPGPVLAGAIQLSLFSAGIFGIGGGLAIGLIGLISEFLSALEKSHGGEDLKNYEREHSFLAKGYEPAPWLGVLVEILIWNPLAVLVYHFPKWILSHVPEVFAWIVDSLIVPLLRAICQFFCLIHCERRVVCAIYSACGAWIGYASQSVLNGAVIGGLLGLVSYVLFELISPYISNPKSSVTARRVH